MTQIQGGCLCGSIRYTGEAQPLMVVACHCTHCRKQSGSAFSVNVVVPLAALEFSGDTPATFHDVGDSGLPVRRRFCAKCGSPLFTELDSMPGVAGLKAGTLDDPSWAQPQANIWCASALPWVSMDADAPRFDANPPQS